MQVVPEHREDVFLLGLVSWVTAQGGREIERIVRRVNFRISMMAFSGWHAATQACQAKEIDQLSSVGHFYHHRGLKGVHQQRCMESYSSAL